MVFYTPWFGFLNMSPIGHLPAERNQLLRCQKIHLFFDPSDFVRLCRPFHPLECHLVICRGPFELPKGTFQEFLCFTVFL